MEKKFQSFWHGSELSPIENACILSFIKRGCRFELFTYDQNLQVPSGVSLRDAREVYDESKLFVYPKGPGKGSVAAFANMFRYKLLYERGGWWVDLDIVYTGHRIPQVDRFFGLQDQSVVNCAILYFNKGSSIARKCWMRAESIGANVSWGETGPNLLTEVIRNEGELASAFPYEYAYPVAWQEAPLVYLPSETRFIEKAVKVQKAPFVHLWNEILRRVGIQKTVGPPSGSYIDRITKDCGVEWPNQPVRYATKDIISMYRTYINTLLKM